MNFMIVSGILVCSDFLISVCMFSFFISSATMIVRVWRAMSCSVSDRVCELFGEIIRDVFGCGCYLVVVCYGSVECWCWACYVG